MTRDEAQQQIQVALAEMERTLKETVLPLAAEHDITFSFQGLTARFWPRYGRETMEVWDKEKETWENVPRPIAKRPLLISDEEWESSSFGCSSVYWDWHQENWPSGEE